jgi:predicted DNA-binding protein (MmcQ/YjbR family)
MDVEQIRNYCLAKADVTEGFPFGRSALVFKRGGKMFLLMMIDEVPPTINVKCDPETALELREEFSCILPGYHMNKKHWNTVIIEPAIPAARLRKWIDDSYNLVRPQSKARTGKK